MYDNKQIYTPMKFIFTHTHNLTNMYPSVKNMYDHSFRTVCKTTCHLDDNCAMSSMGIFSFDVTNYFGMQIIILIINNYKTISPMRAF